MALFGGNFANQQVAATDAAAAYQKALDDGILLGWNLSASGATLTIGKGYLIAHGRIVGNDANLAVTVSGTSGYARVVVVIDLTGAATTSSFTQVSLRVDYASSPDGFPALVQEEINDWTHTAYETALCVLALGSGGIAEIVSVLDTAGPTLPDGTVTAAKLAADIRPVNVGIMAGTDTPVAANPGAGEVLLPEGMIYLQYSAT